MAGKPSLSGGCSGTIGHDQMATTIGNGDESIFMRPGDGSSAWIKAMTIGHGQMATAIVNGDESINILVKVVLLEASPQPS